MADHPLPLTVWPDIYKGQNLAADAHADYKIDECAF